MNIGFRNSHLMDSVSSQLGVAIVGVVSISFVFQWVLQFIPATTGQIFVADSDNNRVQVFDGNLNFLNTILADIEEPLGNPCSIALDSLEECIYVTEYCRHCVIKFFMY